MRTRGAPFFFVFVLVVGCRKSESRGDAVAVPIPVASRAEERALEPTVPIGRETPIRESGGLVLGRVEGERRAFLADEDDAAVVEIDLDRREVVRSTAIGSRPRDVLLLADGTLAITLPDAASVAVFAREERGGLRELRRIATPIEPIAMGLSPDDQELFVTTGASRSLVRVAMPSFAERGRWGLGREPRAVLVGNDGKNVFVTHAADTVVTMVPLDGTSATVARDIGIGRRCLSDFPVCIPRRYARNAHAIVRMGERGVIVPAAQALPNPPSDRAAGESLSGYGTTGSGLPIFMDVATIDSADGSLVRTGEIRSGTACLLPRAAVAVKNRVVVACLGSGRLELLDNPHGRSPLSVLQHEVHVPGGPSAIAVERDGQHIVVWSAFARRLTRLDTEAALPPLVTKPLPKNRPSKASPSKRTGLRIAGRAIDVPATIERDPAWLRGRELFFSNNDGRISGDHRACASCHVDGRDDGITWQTPMGPRRTRMLAGQIAAGPYGWMGEHRTLDDHVKITFKQLLGSGLPPPELAALLTYVRALPAPPRRAMPDAAQGERLFAAAECASCHNGDAGDRSVHDVGTGGAFMTPTLAGIGSRTQLMHDGRYADLEELLIGAKAMGTGSSISADERRALVSYLETL